MTTGGAKTEGQARACVGCGISEHYIVAASIGPLLVCEACLKRGLDTIANADKVRAAEPERSLQELGVTPPFDRALVHCSLCRGLHLPEAVTLIGDRGVLCAECLGIIRATPEHESAGPP